MPAYPSLQLPAYEPRLRQGADGRMQIYDPLRRRFLTLTPEEWVRQHFCHYLTHLLGYPAALLGNEISLQVGQVTRRCDTVLYRPAQGTSPRMIIEYKAPHIAITQRVFTQIQSYNSVLRADYLVVSNGMQHYCCHIDYSSQSIDFLPAVPAYTDLL